jgi:glycerol kinase
VGCTVAIDAGTTGVRALAVDESGTITDLSYRELTQHFPRPGWVEHDPTEIWDAVRATLVDVAGRLVASGTAVAAIGITNQRETAVAWDRRTGRPLAPAIVWQDRRTADRCDRLADAGYLPLVRDRTGLVLDPYFSATTRGCSPTAASAPAGLATAGPASRPAAAAAAIWRSARSTRGCSGT